MSDFLLEHGSYLAITVVLILTGSGLPVPEEVPIIVAGVLSANNTLDPRLAFACCLFGAIVGDTIMYWIGFHFGRSVLREHPRWARWVTPQREAKIESMFRRHGLKVFFVARFLVGLRSPVYLTAGIMRVPFRRFFLIDLFCATAVVGTFFGLTYIFGEHIAELFKRAEVWLTGAVLVAVACAAFYWWRRRRKTAARLNKVDQQEESVPSDVPETPNDEAAEVI
ncbi:MAG: DedA family protein [Pirellulales bacterium]|nr:DedA family protein [Pirellulales bacterium]